MKRTIHLEGFLGKKYGKKVTLRGAEWFRVMGGLKSRFGPQIAEDIRANDWHLISGKRYDGQSLGEEDLPVNLPKGDLHLVPAVGGGDGATRVILGVILIAAFFFTGNPLFLKAGLALALSGAAELMARPPTASATENQPDNASLNFNQARNVTSQGGPVPIANGFIPRVSSVLISADYSNDRI